MRYLQDEAGEKQVDPMVMMALLVIGALGALVAMRYVFEK